MLCLSFQWFWHVLEYTTVFTSTNGRWRPPPLQLELFCKYQFYLLIFCCFHLFFSSPVHLQNEYCILIWYNCIQSWHRHFKFFKDFLQGTFEVASTLFTYSVQLILNWERIASHADLPHEWFFCIQCRMSTHGVQKGIKTMGLHHKQEISNTASCLETTFYARTMNVLISSLYFNFNLNNFSNIINHLL